MFCARFEDEPPLYHTYNAIQRNDAGLETGDETRRDETRRDDEAGEADGAFSARFALFFRATRDPVPSHLSLAPLPPLLPPFLPPLEGNSFRS